MSCARAPPPPPPPPPPLWGLTSVHAGCCLPAAGQSLALLTAHTHLVAPIPRLAADTLDGCKVGETVQVEVLRGGRQRKTLTLQLAERQPEVTE